MKLFTGPTPTATLADREQQLRLFLVGFGAALTLYSKSLKLIQAYEREPLVRNKLNEADPKSELEAGFFEELLRGYSSPRNYLDLVKATWFWRAHRREIQRLALASPAEWKWLVAVIRRELVVVRQRLLKVLGCRLRYDWRAFFRTVFAPVQATRYSLRSQIAGACAGIRTTRHYVPALGDAVIAPLHPQLLPGDVLLVRAEQKLTSAILPGFWAHAAIFVGGAAEADAIGLKANPAIQKWLDRLAQADQGHGCVIEAISPCVRISSLEFCLCADHVAVLRPRLDDRELRAAIVEAFRYLETPYDFEFDFNLSTRVVCTGLIYRCFHHRGGIEFGLIKRLGRYTLSGDDIMNQWLAALDSSPKSSVMPFTLIALVLKTAAGEAVFVPRDEGPATMRKLQSGWRPNREGSSRPATPPVGKP